jgi:hypothetical protein
MKRRVDRVAHEEPWRDLPELWAELHAEVQWLRKAVWPEPASPGEPIGRKVYPDVAQLSPVERRLLVKSVFSFIEAVTFMVKTLALLADEKAQRLSPGEVALAKEEAYGLKESGSVQVRPARLRFRDNFLFAFRLIAKAEELDYELDVSCAAWQALQRALRVRDRLTHPKRMADLGVTEDEARDAIEAFEWVDQQLSIVCAKTIAE